MPTVVLSMIVKNEAPVIERCLASVRPFIDRWAIVDTGSTDGTQDIVRRVMSDIPGVLHERPWVDFATNRTEALHLAKAQGDYTLIIDADDVLAADSGFVMPELTMDAYHLRIDFASITYFRPHLIRSALDWKWQGVIHEFLTCPEAQSSANLRGLAIKVNHDGARRRDPLTYLKDVAVLEEALKTETDPFMVSRYRFYLAQSYRDCGQHEESIKNYLVRAELGFWVEEVYLSLLYAGRMLWHLGRREEAVAAFERAVSACSHRSEASFELSKLYSQLGRHRDAYAILKPALRRPAPSGLFVENWVYERGIEDQYATAAYWADQPRDSLSYCIDLLSRPNLSAPDRNRIAQNARFALGKLSEPAPPADGQALYNTLLGNMQASFNTLSLDLQKMRSLWTDSPAPKQERVLVALETCSKPKYQQRTAACVNSWGRTLPENFELKICTGDSLNVSDEYNALPDKTQAIVRYAFDHNYDWLLIIDDDAFVRTAKLTIPVGHDYAGWVFPPTPEVPWSYCSGGCYWLSRRAMEIVARADQEITRRIGPLEDVWVGHSLMKHGIKPAHLPGFVVAQDHLTAEKYRPFNPDWEVMIQVAEMEKLVHEEANRKLATVFSVYAGNVHSEVLTYQKMVVDKFLPASCEFKQYRPAHWISHAAALTECQALNSHPVTIFLDIDCIPLKAGAFEVLVDEALNGNLVGAVQRANHIENGQHLYAGPFCMAFSNSQYAALGRPTLHPTLRGDCAEELTYRWEEAGQPVRLLWPTSVRNPLWPLRDGKMFGHGTTYNELFYHTFEMRGDETRALFVEKCREILG